jgi:hypothetical protein
MLNQRKKKDERHVTGLFGPNFLTAYSQKSSKNILNNFTQHSKGTHMRITHTKERSKKNIYIYINCLTQAIMSIARLLNHG